MAFIQTEYQQFNRIVTRCPFYFRIKHAFAEHGLHPRYKGFIRFVSEKMELPLMGLNSWVVSDDSAVLRYNEDDGGCVELYIDGELCSDDADNVRRRIIRLWCEYTAAIVETV